MEITTPVETPPSTPSKSAIVNTEIELVVKTLNRSWNFGLETLDPKASPDPKPSAERTCYNNIKFLCYREAIWPPLQRFENEAKVLYSGWVSKPKAERGVVPEVTRQRSRPVTPRERTQLIDLFIRLTGDVKQTLLAAGMARTPGRRLTSNVSGEARPPLNDDPIGINLSITKSVISSKRSSEENEESIRQRQSSKRSKSYNNQTQNGNPFVKPAHPSEARRNYGIFSRVPSDSSIPLITTAERGKKVSHSSQGHRTANTSFASSHQSSIFDRGPLDTLPALTQETVPDLGDSIAIGQEADLRSSENYGSSFDLYTFDLDQIAQADITDTAIDTLESETVRTEADDELSPPESLPSPEEKRLRDRLKNVFPDNEDIPPCFFRVPLHVRYEILRIFLFTGVSLINLKLPDRKQDWTDYNTIWTLLRKLDSMKNKVFPEKVGKEAWAAANDDQFRQGHRGITMTGSLDYADSSLGPLFKFRLEPLKLELTHRLSRRFGCDRFMEIDIPCLTGGRKFPKVMQDLGPWAKSIVIEWLAHLPPIMSRYWVAFCTKAKERKQNKERRANSQADSESELTDRVFYFAVDGDEFRETVDNVGHKVTPNISETVNSRSTWSVHGLLNWLRPIRENRDEFTHKLYARTSLALSRNTPTVVIERSNIRYRPDIKNERGKDMTDGAGRISQALSRRITQALGLSHLPSGFQARFGEAKGFWSVDPNDCSADEWIEVYESQQKWKRKGTVIDQDFNDPAHRTFEVNKFSGKLKPADLNQQLMPILMDRAMSRTQMRQALIKLVENCLRDELDKERIAMNNPQTFRKWVRDGNTGLTDRVKHGCVPFKAAMPDRHDEKMNMLLEAGFEPLKLFYLKELAREAYQWKCKDLEQDMHVTIAKSTNAYMVPDWTGSLEQGEVFLHLSEGFSDGDLSFFTGLPLRGDVLVARNPAHFNSDIQRVRAVVATELLGLRDVVVFSTKGECLADKLSGGDYDGDQAWICWDCSIVDNFKNANVPQSPDLVDEGYITKDATKYKDLVRGKEDETATFINYSMEFSLDQKLVGICTNYKERWCYTYGNIDSNEAVCLSKLLSDLVDQAKSGYIFTNADFERLKQAKLMKTKVKSLPYKMGITEPKSKNIIDQLKYAASEAVQSQLSKFAKELPQNIPCWDDDLVSFAVWAQKEAIDNAEWCGIMIKLTRNIEDLKTEWSTNFGGNTKAVEETKPGFGPFVEGLWERFHAIQPAADTPLTRLLLSPWNGRPELSNWASLRASVLFKSYTKHYVSNFVWWMSGIQLCHMKAMKQGITVAVTPQQYAMLKPDSTYVKLRMSANEYQWDAAVFEGEGNADDTDDLYGDDD